MTENALESPSLELGRFVVVLRRRWRALLFGLLVGMVAAVGYLLLMPVTVTASTLVDVNVISAEPFNQVRPDSDLVDSETEIQLARSTEVVTKVSDSFGGDPTPAEVRNATSAVLLADGTVLRVSYGADSVFRAESGADALARDYLDYRSAEAQKKVDTILDQLTARRSELQAELITVQADAAKRGSTSVSRARAQARTQVINVDLGAVASQMSGLQSLDTTGGTVLSSADAGTTSITPRKALVAAGGLLGGLLLGLILAFLANVVDRRVRDEHDIEAAGGGAVLSRLRKRSGSVPSSDADADEIRSLRERLLTILPDDEPVVAVADVSRKGAPTDIATNLAIVTAQTGLTVQLVLPEHPHRFVNALTPTLRLTPTGGDGHFQHFASTRYGHLTVTVPGDRARGGSNSADQVVELLQRRGRGFGLTLIAIPPDSTRSLRLAAGRLGHAFVLVVAERDARIEQIAALSTELRAVRGVVHGTVLVPRGRRMVPTKPAADDDLDGAHAERVSASRS